MIRYLGLGDFNNRNLFSHTSGSGKSQIKVRIESVSSEHSFWLVDGGVFDVSL